ncbi:MAG: hypothetical protein SPJ83_07705 [Helicobacter sp.]|nr:hypothetical protein [Helicobacter sp.]MDY5822651.1 hypothetical protein [Helicobacter sp.]
MRIMRGLLRILAYKSVKYHKSLHNLYIKQGVKYGKKTTTESKIATK